MKEKRKCYFLGIEHCFYRPFKLNCIYHIKVSNTPKNLYFCLPAIMTKILAMRVWFINWFGSNTFRDVIFSPWGSSTRCNVRVFSNKKKKKKTKIQTFHYILLILFPKGGRKEETWKNDLQDCKNIKFVLGCR